MRSTADFEAPLIVGLLIRKELLDPSALEDLPKARATYRDSLEEALVHSKLAAEEAIAEAYAEHLGIPWLAMAQGESGQGVIRKTAPSGETSTVGTVEDMVEEIEPLTQILGDAVCRRNKILPISSDSDGLQVICINPTRFSTLEELRVRTGRVIRPLAVTLGLLERLSASVFGERDRVREIASAPISSGPNEDEHKGILDVGSPDGSEKDGQVIRIVNYLLSKAIDLGASDIHLEPYEQEVRARYRVDGKLQETGAPPRDLFIPVISRLKILSKMDIAEKRIPQDGAIALVKNEQRVDLRVSTVPTVHGEKMVIRLLRKDSVPDDLQVLGFTSKQAADFLEAVRSPDGLVFVTGPTGSGKSTTLYCCLNLVNDPERNIMTVEDPVEYKFTGPNQIQVQSRVGLTFSSALRAFLRQDPDLIMVGEVRDQETAQICMRAALTGHLVLSTLHTNDSMQVVNRLLDMGVEPFLLGPALRLVQAQRLARRLCGECKVPIEIPADAAARHGLGSEGTVFRHKPGGCEACRGRGYKGRIGLYEVIPIKDGLREMIVKRSSHNELRREAANLGFGLLADSARRQVLAGLTSLEEVEEYTKIAE